jgi:hypothetical protein
LTASDSFDARAAFQLLSTIEREIRLPAKNHLAVAMEASLAACGARQGHSAAVARYALKRVTIEIESRADVRIAAVRCFDPGGRTRPDG